MRGMCLRSSLRTTPGNTLDLVMPTKCVPVVRAGASHAPSWHLENAQLRMPTWPLPSRLVCVSQAGKALRKLISEPQLYLKHYSKDVIYSDAAAQAFVPPDKKPLPNIL